MVVATLRRRSCDDGAQAAFGSVWSGAIVLTRSPGGGRTRSAAADLGGARSAAASGAHLQAVERPEICRQGARCHWSLYQSAGSMPWCCQSMRRAKSRCSTAPSRGLPMKRGRCGTMTHDYKRHGTTTLFAALNVLDGKVGSDARAAEAHGTAIG